jgi:dTDP-4-amino-4,6-dideoxygalactose transaminase
MATSIGTDRPEVPRRAASDQTWRVPLSDILVDDQIESAVMEVVRSGWWSMGPRVAQFEREYSTFCGAKHAVAVANGTAALHLALLAVGCRSGDEVVLPALTFVAAANAVAHTGATPIFCDITGFDDLNVSPEDLESAIGPATRAVIVMHYGGNPCRMDEILSVAARHDVAVIEDAAHAPGAMWRNRMCGTIGDVGCFSFFSNKNLPTGEGGMVVTDDDAIAERIRLLRSHGMTTLTWDRDRGHAHSYDVIVQGFNYRLDDLRAAIGLVQLRRLEQQNRQRARLVAFYREVLDGVNGLRMPFIPQADVSPSHHLAVVILPDQCPRDEFRAFLADRGIQTSVHYPPIHQFSTYRALRSSRRLVATEAVAHRLVTLPLYPHMTDIEASAVTDAVLAGT